MSNKQNILQKIKQSIFVIRQFAKRDRQRNNSSALLGQLWQIITPLINMIVMVVIFSDMLGNNNFMNYPIYVLIGTTLYSLFSEGTEGCLNALSANKTFLIKSKIAREIYPLEKVYVAFVNFLFSGLILLVFAIRYRILFKMVWFLIIPDIILYLILIIGIGKILSIINAVFADIQYFYKIIRLFIFYASALFYDTSRMSPVVQKLISYNPIYLVIAIVRLIIIDGIIPRWTIWVKLFVYSIGMYIIGTAIYQKNIQDVIKKI